MASVLEQLTGELAKNPSDADAVQRFAEKCLERSDGTNLKSGLEPTLQSVMGPLAVRPIAQAFARALMRAAKVLAQIATDRLGAARALANAWRIVPDERVATLAQTLFQGTADVPEYTLAALANVGQGEQRLSAMRKLAASALERRKLDAAETLFKRLEAVLPSDVDAAVGQAMIAKLRADADARVLNLEDTLGSSNIPSAAERPRLQRELGDAHRSAGRRDAAEKAYVEAIRLGDDAALRAHEALMREAGKLDELVAFWEALLPTLPRERQWSLRRRLHHVVNDELGRRDDARRLLAPAALNEKLVVDVPTTDEALALEADEPRAAATAWEEIAAQAAERPARINALEHAGLLWEEIEDSGAAERVYRKLRALDPHSRNALAFFRAFYQDHNDPRRAYQNLAQLHALEPRLAERQVLATEMAELAEGALQSLDKAIESWKLREKDLAGSDPTQVWSELKRLYAATGRWHAYIDLLEKWIERARAKSPETAIQLLFDIVEVYQDKDKLPMPALVLATYQRIVQLAPKHADALDRLAVGLEAREQWNDLLPVLSQKIELATEPQELVPLFQRVAEIYLDHIRSESQAVAVLEKLLEIAPDDIEVVQRLRELHRRRHDSEQLYRTLARELELTDPNAQVERIRVLSDLGHIAGHELLQPQAAVGHWRAVLALDPQNARALEALSSLHAEEQDWPAFIKVLEQRVSDAKTKTAKLPLMLELGEALYTRVGDLEGAEKVFQQIAETSPTSQTARRFLQRIFVARRKWQDLARLFTGKPQKGVLPAAKWKEYVALLKDAAKHEQDAALVADIQVEIARVSEDHLDDRKGALEALDAALKASEERIDLARKMATMMSDDVAGKLRINMLTTLARHSPEAQERHQSWLQLASIHRRAKDSVHATDAWARALVAGAELGLGDALSGLEEEAGSSGRWEQAYQAIDEALARLPADALPVRATFHRALGNIARARLMQPDEAIRHFKWVLLLVPGEPFALEELEKIHFSRNDFAGLEEVYRARLDAALGTTSNEDKVGAAFKLARLYEDILLDPERAALGYQDILALAPNDDEALAGLQRSLDAAEAWGDLAASLEAVLTRVPAAQRSKRNSLHLRLAGLYADKLGEPLAAIDHTRAVLDADGEIPQASFEAAIALLERLVQEPSLRQDVSPVLETTYRKRRELDKLAQLLEARLDDAPKEELPGILDELAMLAASALDAPEKAFEALLRRFRLTPAEPDVWVELERAAQTVGSISAWETIASAYSVIVTHQGRILGAQRAPLRLRLAEIQHKRLIDLEEAIVQTEAAIAESRDEEETLRALESLEVLYKKTADLESFVRVKLEASRRVISRAIRRQKVSEAAQALAGALGKPAEGVATLEPLWREDPGDAETFDLLTQLIEKTSDWTRLDQTFADGIPMARDPRRKDELRYRRALLRRDRLGLWETAISELIGLVDSAAVGNQARTALLDISRARESEAQRDVILEVLDAHYRGNNDSEGLLAVLLVTADFASGPDKARVLRDAAKVALPPETTAEQLAEAPERAAHALDLYLQALLEHPGDRDSVLAMEELAQRANLWGEYAEALTAAAENAGETSAARGLWRAEARAADKYLGDQARAIASWSKDLALGEALGEQDLDPSLDALDLLFQQSGDTNARLEILHKKDERAKDPLQRAQILEEIALLQLATGLGDEAVTTLEKALEELGRTNRARSRVQRQRILATLESVLKQGGRYEEIVDLLVQASALEDEPHEKRELLHRAAEMAADQLIDEPRAIVLYERLVDRDGTDEAAIARLVQLYTRTERWAECVTALNRQRALAEAAGAEAEARELSFRVGEIWADRLGDAVAAVGTFGRVLRGDPAHKGALAALARYEDDDAGVATEARAMLADAYRSRGEHAALARVLELSVAAGEANAGVLRELSALWSGPLKEPGRAWTHATMGYALDPLGSDGQACRAYLLALGKATVEAGEGARRLVDALVEVLDALPEGGVRLERKRADLAAVEALDPNNVAMIDRVPLWRTLLVDDPKDARVLDELELFARESEPELGPALLAEALSARAFATDPVAAIPIEVELASVLGRMPGREPDAIDVLVRVLGREPERPDAVDALAQLYDTTGQHVERAALYEDQLALNPARLRLAELRRALATTLWKHLADPSRAVVLFGEILQDNPSDTAAAESLEAIWGEGAERPAIYRILEPRYQRLADWDKLVALYTSTLEQDDPELQIECLSKLAELERAQLDKPEAAFTTLMALVERLEAGAEVDSAETTAHLDALEGLAQRLDRWDELVERLESLVAMSQGGWPLMARLGRIHDRARGDADRAIHFYGFAYERAPEDRETRDGLAELLERTERWDELQALLLKAVVHSRDLDDRLRLRRRAARVLDEKLGRPREAVRALEAIVADASPQAVNAPAPAIATMLAEAHETIVALLERIQDYAALHKHYRRWLEQAASDEVAVDLQVRLGRSLIRFPDTAREGLTELEEVLRTATGRRDVVPTLWSMIMACDKLEATGEEVDHAYAEATADAAKLLEEVLGDNAPAGTLAGIVQAQLRVLPQGEERRATLMRLASLETELDRIDLAFGHYAEALRNALGDAVIEKALESLAEAHTLWTELAALYEECAADPDHEAHYGLKVAEILRTKLQRPAEAAQWYERHLAVSPGSRPALEQLASYYQEARDPASEARILESWIDYSATPIELPILRMRLGILRMDQLGDATGAIDAFEGCLPDGANDAELVKRLERLYIRGNHFKALVELYQAALRFVPAQSNPKEHLEILAKVAQVQETRLGDQASARDVCRRMLAIEPLHRFGLTTLERVERALGDWEAVDEVLGKKLQAAPNDEARAKVLIDRADVAATHRKRLDDALEHLLQADKLVGPGAGSDELVKGFEGLLRGDAQQRLLAARALQKRYRARQSWTSLINVLLLELVATGTPEERFALAQQAYDIATDRLRDRLLALRVLLAALRQTPQTLPLRELVEATAGDVGDWGMVIRTGEETLKRLDTKDEVISFALWLGPIVQRHGAAQVALKIYERVLEVDPGNAAACDSLAALYRARGDWAALRGLHTERIATAGEKDRPRLELVMLLDLADAPESGGLDAVIAALRRHIDAHAGDRASLEAELDQRVTHATSGMVATAALAHGLRFAGQWKKLVDLLARRAAVAPFAEKARLHAEAATILESSLDDRVGALEALGQAIAAEPGNAGLWRRFRDLGQAIAAWETVAKVLGTDGARVTDVALARELALFEADALGDRLGDETRAIAALQAAIARDAMHVEARLRLLALWKRKKDLDAYERDVTTLAALVSPPEAATDLWRQLRDLARELDDERREVVADEALLAIDPLDFEAADHLAALHRTAGRAEDLSDLLFLRIQTAQGDPVAGARFWAELADLRATQLGDEAGAVDAWREAFTLDAANVQAATKTQEALETQGDYTRAAEIAALHAAALEDGPSRVAAWVKVAKLYDEKLRMPNEAASAWEAVLEDAPDSMEALNALIGLYGRARRFDELAQTLEQKATLVATPHDRYVAQVQAAAIHLDQRKDLERARVMLDAVLREDQSNIEGRLLFSRLQIRSGEPRLAAATLAALAEEVEGKRKARILMDLAKLESIELSLHDEAVAHARSAWAIDPTVPGLDALMVQVLQRAGDFVGLAAHHESAYASAPNAVVKAQHALDLARLYANELGDSVEATDALEKWLTEARKSGGAQAEVGLLEADLAVAREDFDVAEDKLVAALTILKERKQTDQIVRRSHELGRVRQRLGKAMAALEAFAKAHELDGKYLPNLIDYGHALIEAKRWTEALQIHQALLLQRTSITDEDERHGVLERLAIASWEVGQRERARQYLQRLLSERPDHESALALKRRFAAPA